MPVMSHGEKGAMGRQCVLLLCTPSLLGESLEMLLSRQENVELIGPWTPDGQALTRLAETRPDVILLTEEDDTASTIGGLTAQILERCPDIPLIRVGLAHNVVHLYTSSRLPARSRDLLCAIRNLTAGRAREEI